MQSEILSFAFPDEQEDHLVRVVLREGEPWFVAKDVCAILEHSNHRMAVEPLDDDEVAAVSLTYTSSNDVTQNRETLVISESGLYTLVIRSRQATTPGTMAHRFRKWVFGEVLPQIRRTGKYAHTDDAGFDWDEVGAKLKLVREARLVHGRKTAQQIWRKLGLPLDAAPPERTPAVNGVGFVQAFLDEMTEEDAAGRVQASHLYDAFCEWARRSDAPAMTWVAFGRTLTALGLAKTNASRNFYLGIRIRHRSEIEA